MISILLIILKIIGITLLVILGLILLLFLLVLLVPVRYRVKGSYDEVFRCKGKVTWLLHLISIRFEIDKDVRTSVRILGIPLSFFQKFKREKKENRKENVTESVSKDSTDKTDVATATENTTEDTEDKEQVKEQSQSDSVVTDNALSEEITLEEQKPSEGIITKVKNTICSIIEKIRSIINKIKNIIQKLKDIKRNIKEIKNNLKRYIRVLQSDTTKAAFSLCKEKLFKVLKHIFPRKLHADITYGFDDPATTGYSLAVYGMLPAYVGKSIILHPDFDKQILKADFQMKGGIRSGTLLFRILRILFDKNCRRLYHIVKKEIANEHK